MARQSILFAVRVEAECEEALDVLSEKKLEIIRAFAHHARALMRCSECLANLKSAGITLESAECLDSEVISIADVGSA